MFAAIIPVAPATGAAINPARTVGPMLVQQLAGGAVEWSQLPIHLLAELLAGVAAAFAYVAISRSRSVAKDRPPPRRSPLPSATRQPRREDDHEEAHQ